MSKYFDILSRRNPLIKDLCKLRVKRRRRETEAVAFVRGRRVIQAIGNHFPFRCVFTHEPPERWGDYNVSDRVIRVQKDVLQYVLFGNTRQRYAERLDDDGDFVVGLVDRPPPVDDFPDSTRWLLAVDGVRNPENMSLLLGSAVALKYDGLFLTRRCVDHFGYKVLETSQGVAWTLPYQYGTPADLISLCERRGLARCVAHMGGVPLTDLPLRPPESAGFCLAVGSESAGVSTEMLDRHALRLQLPMAPSVESLNAGVAGGILMHGLACSWG